MQDKRIAEFLQLLEGGFIFIVLDDHIITWLCLNMGVDDCHVAGLEIITDPLPLAGHFRKDYNTRQANLFICDLYLITI